MLFDFSPSRPHRYLGRRPTVSIQPVHTRVPGRARFKVTALYRSRELKHRLEVSLGGLDGIHSVQANMLTGSLLVVFDQQEPVENIERFIAERLGTPQSPETGEEHDRGSEDKVPATRTPIPPGQVVHLTENAL